MKHYLLKTTLRLLLAAVMVYLLPMTAWGQGTQPSGSGNSAGDPYQISTRDNLEWMADQIANHSATFEGKFFKLMNEIDLSSSPWTTPIGSDESTDKYFAGVFDGNGYRITGLTIPATGTNPYRGLFGVVGKSSYSGDAIMIKNLAVEIAESGIHLNPTGNSEVNQVIGGIAGLAQSCTIKNCYVTGGGISCSGDLNHKSVKMGGIAGYGYSLTITNCYATVDITLDGGTMTFQSSGDGVDIGGITSMGSISNCFYTGRLKSHATSCNNNDFQFDVGGIAGQGYYLPTTNCLILSQTIEVTKDGSLGKIYAYAATGTSMLNNNNYVLPETTLNGVTPTYNNDGNGTKWENTTDANPPLSDWLANGSWQANGSYLPILLTTEGQPFHIAPTINRQGQIVTLIHNADELAAINTNSTTLASPYKLANNIDLTGYNGDNWTPIGSTAPPFKGTFNGDGYVIEGLNAEGATQVGLFGVIESGTVENLGVKFGTLNSTGASNTLVGGIAGEIQDNSTIQNCYTTGGAIIADLNSFGSTAAGGIIGKGSQSTILNCYSTCNISLVSTYLVYGGGIAGSGTNLTVSNCYSICKIKGIHGGDGGGGSAYAGGIIGGVSSIYGQPTEQSRITNCLALSKEEFDLTNTDGRPDFHSGRILGEKGYNSSATLSNNYATTLMPGSWTAIGADKNDGGDWNGANCTPSDPDAWNIAWTDMTTTTKAIAGPNLPKLKTTGGALINGQGDIDKLLYIGFKLTTTSDANGNIEVKSTSGGTLYNDGDYIPANTELTITAKPNSSYKTASLKVSGSNFTSGSSYIVGSDLATKGTDLTVEATFAMTHTVTVDAAIANGSIEVKKPDGTTLTPGANTVEEGTVLTITATPTTDYQLKQLTADGNPINGNTYTVTGDVTLSAEFEAKSGGGNEGDGGGSTTPTVYHTVTLPAVEGATTDPVAGDYEVEAWGSFRFYLTLDKEYDKSEPVITTDRGETIQPRSSDGAYIVKYVRSDVQILIDSIIKNPDPVGNETVTANQSKVWAAEGYLHIEAGTDGQAYIFTADGRLQKLQPVTTGQAIALPLPEGVYLVRIGDERFKVLL